MTYNSMLTQRQKDIIRKHINFGREFDTVGYKNINHIRLLKETESTMLLEL